MTVPASLFHWQSTVPEKEKEDICRWYDSLSEKDRRYVDSLSRESYEMGHEAGFDEAYASE
jgi:hypothetical protein